MGKETKAIGITLAAALAACAFAAWPVRARSAGRTLNFQDNFTSGNLNAFQMPYPQDWEILSENGLHYLHMKRSRGALVPRRPMQFARLKNIRVGSFDLRAKVRRTGKSHSIIIVFNYVDSLHFYYTHLSVDSGRKISVHNGVFLVDGAPRRRIAGTDAPPALPDYSWHTVRILRNARTGSIKIFMNGSAKPLFSLVDHTFTCGQIGFGSFDETGDFAQIRLRSNDADCTPGSQH